MKFHIVYVDMDKRMQDLFQYQLSKYYTVQVFSSPLNCLKELKKNEFPIVLSKLDLKPISGMEFLRRLEKHSPFTLKMLFANGDYHSKRNGDVSNYPVIQYDCSELNFEQIRLQIDKEILQYHKIQVQANKLNNTVPKIVGNSLSLKNQLEYAQKVSNSIEPILITGETGTGKDLIARYIHASSRRRYKSLHIVNCAAIKAELFESEFFGHVKGAFTGASWNGKGHFLKADQGTLVLDEISEMDINFQVKLLRAIENKEIYPVGSQKIIKPNIRIIALTNRNLQEEILNGRFRKDLYYRLDKIKINLKPLKERPEDIKPLVEYLLNDTWFSLLPDWQDHIDANIYQLLTKLEFPGNVRDLQNLILKVISFKAPDDPDLKLGDFKTVLGEKMGTINSLHKKEDLKSYLKRMERLKIGEELAKNHFNISRTARQLGLSRQSLQQRMRRLNIEV